MIQTTAHKAVYYCNYPTAPKHAQGQDTSQWDLFKPLCALRSGQCNGWGIFNVTKAPTIDTLIDKGLLAQQVDCSTEQNRIEQYVF